MAILRQGDSKEVESISQKGPIREHGQSGAYAIEKQFRPWGSIQTLLLNTKCSVKILDLSSGQRYSFHTHALRDEAFNIIMGGAKLQIGYRIMAMEADLFYFVARGVAHRIAAGPEGARVLEISFGHYDQVFDIVRIEDDYGRVGLDGSV